MRRVRAAFDVESNYVMKALRFSEFGPPSVLRIDETLVPEPGTLQAHNSAANTRPDFAGIVVKGKHREGEQVEYVVVPAETLTPKPKSLSMAQAAAIGIPFITA
jgi:hypothetical protein